MSTNSYLPALAPTGNRVRAFFAPVNRAQSLPTVFDPSQSANFSLAQPPAPWIDLGWIEGFTRQSTSKYGSLTTGSPASTQYQVRESIDALVAMRFTAWSKLTMALAAGSQHMNVIEAASTSAANGSGGKGVAATPLASVGSTATFLAMSAANAANFAAGNLVAVDVDYLGQTGYVGSGVAAAYVNASAAVNNDPDYIRRVSFNVARVLSVSSSGLNLAQPLLAGVPTAAMKVQPILGFVDREGGSFFQEWSGLFVVAGNQGERIYYYYPRLQATAGAEEAATLLSAPSQHGGQTSTTVKGKNMAGAAEQISPARLGAHEYISLAASFRALPVLDSNDGERVVCFRTFVPPAWALI